jgi:hypothetical protein
VVDFIVETGVGIPNANSLVSVEYADEYFAAHPFYGDQWAEFPIPRKKNLLAFATGMISGMMKWGGSAVSTTQTLPWPRYGVVNPEGSFFGTTIIPENLKRAVCEQAYYLSTSQGNPDAPAPTSGVEELKIDVIQIKFGAYGRGPVAGGPRG